MNAYVRICPRCGMANPEEANLCSRDNEFLGLEPAVPAECVVAKGPDVATPPNPASDAPVVADPAIAPALFLELCGSPELFTVPAGATVGQAHSSGLADVPIDGVPGKARIHRRHLRVERIDGKWFAVPLDQAAFGRSFTNPTLLNRRPVRAGERVPLADGDRLMLADTDFTVRIP